MIKISASSDGEGKIYTYGFEEVSVATLEELGELANRKSISGPIYKDEHRKGSNIIAGSNVILIDCDEPGQAEAVEKKLLPYDYVKVPSASNLEKPYKWHFFIPTHEPLSIYPASFKWQVQQFLRHQVGITDDMIDTSGSYDAVRQFAPASIGMSVEEADDLIEINDTGLNVPIIQDPPKELCKAAVKSVNISIEGKKTSKLPPGHLWFEGNAVTYTEAINAINEAAIDNNVASGFGCPFDNHDHTGDRTCGYAYGSVRKNRDVVVTCTGNACKCNPYFIVPKRIDEDTPVVVTAYDKTKAPKLVLSFEKHWTDNLGNISSPALLQNWENNFNAFDEIIERNRDSKPSKKICCPSPTGSGKTQQAIHKAISLYGSGVKTLIVTMRTEDADLIASQIASGTHENYVGVFHSKDVSVADVSKVEKPDDVQCLATTHEMFRRQQGLITKNRDLIIIDEAIDVITHYQIEQTDLENILKIIRRMKDLDYSGKDEELLMSEKRMLTDILEIQFAAMKQSDKSFVGTRPGAVDKELSELKNLEFTQVKKLLKNSSVRPTSIILGHRNDAIDNAVKKKLIDICDNIKLFFRQFGFMTKNGYQVAWSTANELIPGKSLVVMDATASVNKSYSLYMKYQSERLEILPAIECRNYGNVTLHTARTATGRSTILAKNKSKGDKERHKKAKTLSNLVRKITKPGDDALVVTFNELEPSLITFIESMTDRRIRIDHWGNLTGTNKYNTCNKIIIYGLNHKPQEMHRSIHALIKSPLESFKKSDENTMEFNDLIRSDIVAEVIQAINRIRCRKVIDDKGNCDTADVYLTLPAHFGSAQEMMIAIKKEMHNIKVAEWEDSKEDIGTLKRTSFLESFILQLDVLLNNETFEIKLQDALDALALNKKQWRDNIKGHTNFKATLAASGFLMEMRHSISRRGVRSKKANTAWFFRG